MPPLALPHWWHGTHCTGSATGALEKCADIPLSDVIWMFPSERPPPLMISHNAYLSTSLKIWDSLRGRVILKFSDLSSFLHQSWFLPGKQRGAFETWRMLGLMTINLLRLDKYRLEQKNIV